MKVVLVSDNHGDLRILKDVLNNNPCADYYIHCGDTGLANKDIEPFVAVKGNNDFLGDYPYNRILDIGKHKVYICHGHRDIYERSLDSLVKAAKKNDCDIVFFGHLHRFVDVEINGVRLINPGSLEYNRDELNKSYAIVEIGEKVIVKRVVIEY